MHGGPCPIASPGHCAAAPPGFACSCPQSARSFVHWLVVRVVTLLTLLALLPDVAAAQDAPRPAVRQSPEATARPLGSAAPAADRSVQLRVIDGDTIVVDGTHYRLWGIDAPESAQACRDTSSASYACGKVASAHLRELVAGQRVSCEPKTQDRYGRTVAICGTATLPDLGKVMVRDGWAVAFVRYSRDYVKEEAEARDVRRSIWSGTSELPWEWRAAQRARAR